MPALRARVWEHLFPSLCQACGREQAPARAGWPPFGLLCDRCRKGLIPEAAVGRLAPGLTLISAYRPDPVLFALVKGWKYSGRDAVLAPFSEAMAHALTLVDPPRPWHLIPVPLPWPRRLLRGFNQSELLARRIARRCHANGPQELLSRASFAGQQAGRSRAQRLSRAQREFRRRRIPPRGGSLILVDDLCTTGATLMACRRALDVAEGRPVLALVLARVDAPGLDASLLTGQSGPAYLVRQAESGPGADPGRPHRKERGIMLAKLSVRDMDVAGKTVFVRVDYNVPLNDRQEVTDDNRIRASLPTLELLVESGAKIVLASHLGRPKGKYQFEMSLSPVADRLAELVDQPVRFARSCIGEEAKDMVRQLKRGEILLLENLRFHPEEEANDPKFAEALSNLADLYVNDAFGTAHRAHASTEGMTHYFEQRAAGLLMEQELVFLGRLLSEPERPASALLGGAKISGKIPVIENLLVQLDTLMIGGGMAFTFFKALGLNIGKSIVDDNLLDTARKTIRRAKEAKREILLPVDVVVAKEATEDAQTKVLLPTDIPDGWMGLDIGPKTVDLYSQVIQASKSIFWNGPMGVFEVPRFARGTFAMARCLADATAHGATTVVGGGDSVAAINKLSLAGHFTHVSTGGGASLEFMEGKVLPGVAALSDAKEAMV